MSKVRVGYEDIFIAHITNADKKHDKDYFVFYHKWVVKNNNTKRREVRKIKAYLMNLTADIGFAIDYSNNAEHHIQIH
jgi:hypothetical protein